jgi:CheY-like chemotaxis protein
LNILIIDDNARMRSTIKNILGLPGIAFVECDDGLHALARYSEARPSWVLMDIKMPGTNGFQAAQNILAEYPEARIIFITDYDDKEFRAAAKRIGAAAYIVKEELIKLREICSSERV